MDRKALSKVEQESQSMCCLCLCEEPCILQSSSSRTNVTSCFTCQHYFLGTVFLSVLPNHLFISPFLVINIALPCFFSSNHLFTKAGPSRGKEFCQHIDLIKGKRKKLQLVPMLFSMEIV